MNHTVTTSWKKSKPCKGDIRQPGVERHAPSPGMIDVTTQAL